MSIKEKLKRKLNSPANILIPFKFKEDLQVTLFFEKILNNMYEMYSLLTKSQIIKTINEDYSVDGYEVLVATDELSITLPEEPFENQEVIIKSMTLNTITIIGNGKNIDGSSTLLINTQYDNIRLIYIKSQDAWGKF